MSHNHSTMLLPSGKPAKPYPAFPLFPHATKRWAKKIRGRLFYFGPWSDPDGALAKYLEQEDAVHAGRKPRTDTCGGVTVKELCNAFLNGKQALVESGELLARTWKDYKFACDLIISRFGKSRLVANLWPDDFAALRNYMAKRWAVTSARTVIQWIRCIFKFAYDNRLISEPIFYGQSFKRPSPKVMRLERARRGPKLLRQQRFASCSTRLRCRSGGKSSWGSTAASATRTAERCPNPRSIGIMPSSTTRGPKPASRAVARSGPKLSWPYGKRWPIAPSRTS